MRRLFLLALGTAVASMAIGAQAVPVALHYDVSGGDAGYYSGPPGALGFSFDLYYDPTLLGLVSANGGQAGNGQYFFSPYSLPTGGSKGMAARGPLPNVQANVSLLDKSRYPDPFFQNLRQLSVLATGNDARSSVILYVNQDGTFGYTDYSNGVTVYANGVRHFSESQAVQTSAVPETATWAMLTAGVGMIGGMLRRRRKVTTRSAFAP